MTAKAQYICTAMSIDQDRLKSENQALVVNIKEKTRKQQQTQELYDRLKRKEMTTATQHAAFDSVEGMLGGGGTGTPGRPYTRSQAQREHHNRPPNLDGTNSHRGHGSAHGSHDGMMPPPPINRNGYQGGGPNFGRRSVHASTVTAENSKQATSTYAQIIALGWASQAVKH